MNVTFSLTSEPTEEMVYKRHDRVVLAIAQSMPPYKSSSCFAPDFKETLKIID
jgi:hypothetical protein